jgi:hypothetical protein
VQNARGRITLTRLGQYLAWIIAGLVLAGLSIWFFHVWAGPSASAPTNQPSAYQAPAKATSYKGDSDTEIIPILMIIGAVTTMAVAFFWPSRKR